MKKTHEVDWSTKVLGLSYNEQDIIKGIIQLHNNGEPFELDPTFSKGNVWKGLIEPKYRFDLVPQRDDVLAGDCRETPFKDDSVSSIFFDPPFVVAPSPKPGIIRDRFSCYKTPAELWQFYLDSLIEFKRILKPNGIIAFKCQPIVSGSLQYMSHFQIGVTAQMLGLYVKDQFILGRENVIWSPNMENQKNARKNYSFYLVLQKIKFTKTMMKTLFIPQELQNGTFQQSNNTASI